jgi:hypothetical protein
MWARNFGGHKLKLDIIKQPLADNASTHVTSSSSKFFAAATSHLDPTSQFGEYAFDLAQKTYTLSWDSLEAMELWLQKEQASKFIELRAKETIWGTKDEGWTSKHVYVCSRQGTGGVKKYKKKFPLHERKIPDKRVEGGCGSRLLVKSYPNMDRVLGHYEEQHTHPTGSENARFMRLPTETRIQITELLRSGISPKKIVSIGIPFEEHFRYQLHDQLADFQSNQKGGMGPGAVTRSTFVTARDVRRIEVG